MSQIKGVKSDITITAITAKSGGSIRASFYTPELDKEERNAMLDLHDLTCEALFVPKNTRTEEIIEIDTDLQRKSQSVRIRSCLYVMWTQEGKPGTFEEYYKNKTESIIEWLKSKLK